MQLFVAWWCSGHHWCKTSFNSRIESCLNHASSLWWWAPSIAMARNKAQYLSSFNHFPKKSIHHFNNRLRINDWCFLAVMVKKDYTKDTNSLIIPCNNISLLSNYPLIPWLRSLFITFWLKLKKASFCL